jgi:hypothetical protein
MVLTSEWSLSQSVNTPTAPATRVTNFYLQITDTETRYLYAGLDKKKAGHAYKFTETRENDFNNFYQFYLKFEIFI